MILKQIYTTEIPVISGYYIAHILSTSNKNLTVIFSLSHRREQLLTLAFWPNSNYLASFNSTYYLFELQGFISLKNVTISDHPSPL